MQVIVRLWGMTRISKQLTRQDLRYHAQDIIPYIGPMGQPSFGSGQGEFVQTSKFNGLK